MSNLIPTHHHNTKEKMKERGRERETYGLLGGHHGWGWVLVRLRMRVLLLRSRERERERDSFASNTAKELWNRMKDLIYTESSTRVQGVLYGICLDSGLCYTLSRVWIT